MNMRRLRKSGLALLVGLTAATTLVAGMPHFFCRCPNGREKLCFAASGNQCCCGGSCCPSKGGEKACQCGSPGATGCCCSQPKNQASGTSSGDRVEVTSGCCLRTLVKPDIKSLPGAKAAASDPGDSQAPFALEPATDYAPPMPEAIRAPWHALRVSPPTDLVIVLQRLTI